VKRRICLVGAAVSVILMAFGVAGAMASKTKTKTKTVTKPVAVVCHTKTTIVVPSGQTGVTPPVSQGSEYGIAGCGKFGRGVQSDQFNVPDSGDTLATFTWYLPTGSIKGKYDLTPQEGTLNFLSVDYVGKLTILGGTGAFAGVKGKGPGTMVCQSPDSVHTSCTDNVKLKLAAAS
jgi:hypothetical protein